MRALSSWPSLRRRPLRPATTTDPKLPEPVIPTPSELSPVLDTLAWLAGDWQSDDGTEHWIPAGGAIYGVALQANGMFEVMIVDDGEGTGPADGVVRLIAMPGGAKAVEFKASAHDRAERTVRQPRARRAEEHHVRAHRRRAERGARHRRQPPHQLRVGRGHATAAPELEAADRAFAADIAARGIEGWMAAFAPDGGMLKQGRPRHRRRDPRDDGRRAVDDEGRVGADRERT